MRDLKCTHTPRHDYTKVWESEVNDACSSRATMFKDTSTGINNIHPKFILSAIEVQQASYESSIYLLKSGTRKSRIYIDGRKGNAVFWILSKVHCKKA